MSPTVAHTRVPGTFLRFDIPPLDILFALDEAGIQYALDLDTEFNDEDTYLLSGIPSSSFNTVIRVVKQKYLKVDFKWQPRIVSAKFSKVLLAKYDAMLKLFRLQIDS